MRPAIHYTHKYLMNPTNQITIILMGAGGTGTKVLTELLRMNEAMLAMGGPGFQVMLFDDKKISAANKGRLIFSDEEIGLYKSVVFINRANRAGGTNWKAVTQKFDHNTLHGLPNKGMANIYISCVDTVSARFEIARVLERFELSDEESQNKPLYWLDFGNAQYTGQAILSTIGFIEQPESKKYRPVGLLPKITDEFKDLLEQQVEDNRPSCSVAEALGKQDLSINATLACMGISLLSRLLNEGMTNKRGFFIDLSEFRTEPLRVN